MKIDRLIAITNYLLHHGKTSAQKLAEQFEVSPRTIMRDMDALSEAGIPIQSTFGVDGGYALMDTYVVDKQIMSEQDYSHVISALRGLLSAYHSKALEQTMDKVLSIPESNDSVVQVDFSVANEKRDVNSYMHTLENAIRQEQVVEFRYTNSEDVEKTIQVEPARLEFKWYNWYLIAFYPKNQEYCMFKLVRMEKLTILDKKHSVNHAEQEITIQDKRNVLAITLRGKGKVKGKCKEYLNGEVTQTYPNGDFEFQFMAPEGETYWFGVLMSLGDNVTVIEPKSVRDRLLKTCNEIMKNYKNGGKEMDIYKNCQVMESERYTLRLTQKDDTADLLKVYSDKKAVPFFNGDNCHGDDFYYQTMERMQEAVNFWIYSYENRWFVRWSIVDKQTKEAVGTIEAFHRAAEDSYDGYGLFRLDLRSDYERKDIVNEILEVFVPNVYSDFDCTKCMTKAVPEAIERIAALQQYGFHKSEIPLIGGDDHKEYFDYWVISL